MNKARFDVGREWYSLYSEQPTAVEMKASAEKKKPGSFNFAVPSHMRNVLECIRRHNEPNAPVEAGQRQTWCCA
jgi:hypothetical protein